MEICLDLGGAGDLILELNENFELPFYLRSYCAFSCDSCELSIQYGVLYNYEI